MKKSLLAAAAAMMLSTVAAGAADLPVKARPYVAPIVWSWTGFYIGGHVGAGWGTTESTLTGLHDRSRRSFRRSPSTCLSPRPARAVSWVACRLDITGRPVGLCSASRVTSLAPTSRARAPASSFSAASTKTDWLASVTGRLGAVVLDRGLVYVKGGAAWQNSTHTVTLPSFGGVGGQDLTSREITHFGWTIGMGTEWMITPNWTAFVEYNYYEFDKKNYEFPLNLGAGIPGSPSASMQTSGTPCRPPRSA